jgi:hypothetical protein
MTPQDSINYIWWGAAILAAGIYIKARTALHFRYHRFPKHIYSVGKRSRPASGRPRIAIHRAPKKDAPAVSAPLHEVHDRLSRR